MSDGAQSGDGAEGVDRPQDPLVERLRPDPGQPPESARIIEGLLGDSDRPGLRRLYFTTELDYYAEFRNEDVLSVADIAPDQAPFLGEQATRVTLRRDATVDFTHTRRSRPLDEFDLDIRLAARPRLAAQIPFTANFVCQPQTFDCADTWPLTTCGFGGGCGGGGGPQPTRGCETRDRTICIGNTCIDVCTFENTDCETCQTCEQATCQTCDQATCQTCPTRCNQDTCQTCATQCGTCHTRCNQDTCRTCETNCGGTCNQHVFTCGPNPQCAPQ